MSLLSPEALEVERARVDLAREQLMAEADNCRYCKGIRTRRHNKLHENQMRYGRDVRPGALERADTALCTAHSRRLSMLWRTSPASETYWAS